MVAAHEKVDRMEGEREKREGEGEGGGREREWKEKRSCEVQKDGQANQQ